jgi:hypothetical protein
MQYNVKDTVGFPVIASVDTPVRFFDANDAPTTIFVEQAGAEIGSSTGVVREVATASKGNILILEVETNGWGTAWVDLSKVYFTTAFGVDDVKHSVKGSAYYDEKEKSSSLTDDENDIVKRGTDILKSGKDLLDAATGKKTSTKKLTDTNDEDEPKTTNWANIAKWVGGGVAVLLLIWLAYYLITSKDEKPDIGQDVATPAKDVPTTLSGVAIPRPQNLT